MPARRSITVARWIPLVLAVACSPGSPEPPQADGSTGASTSTGPGVTSTSGSPTTGADASSTGASGSSDSTGSDFIIKGDGLCNQGGPGGATSRCTIECSPTAQDCPEGSKCMPWANDGGNAWNASRCSPIAPDPVPPGGACTVDGGAVSGVDDCEPGAMCWGVDPTTLQGTCVEFCEPLREPSSTCVEPDACVALNEGYVPLCLHPCDPLDPAACPDGEACRHVEAEGAFYCLPLVGGQVAGSSQYCDDDATCLPSEVCVPAGLAGACPAPSCCTALCDLADPGADDLCAALDPTLGCEPFYEPGAAPPGLELVGLCAVPP